MATKAPRTPERVLNYGTGPPDDGHDREWDTCPHCGRPRWQLIIVPDRFHCDKCEKAGPRNDKPPPEPEPEQLGLDGVPSNEVEKQEQADGDRPPLDESDAWLAEEMPDE